LRIEPTPTPEEAAVIAAALKALRAEDPQALLNRSRWRLAGLLGHAVPQRMKLEGSLWSYSSWEGMT
jgi:predicted DNA-binding transcriptional regulator YafY